MNCRFLSQLLITDLTNLNKMKLVYENDELKTKVSNAKPNFKIAHVPLGKGHLAILVSLRQMPFMNTVK